MPFINSVTSVGTTAVAIAAPSAAPSRCPPDRDEVSWLTTTTTLSTSGVQAEIAGGALARILDNPKAVSTQPAAAKVLAALLEKLRSAAARPADDASRNPSVNRREHGCALCRTLQNCWKRAIGTNGVGFS
jgi:hypothetical protein